jgi:hypothetical protein
VRSKTAVIIKKAALITGLLFAGGTLIFTGGLASVLAAIIFSLWVASPYLVVAIGSRLVERHTQVPGRYGIGSVVAILMSAFSLMAYVGTLGDKSSTYGLIFIFVPLWLHIGGIGLYGICILIAWLAEWSQQRASQ